MNATALPDARLAHAGATHPASTPAPPARRAESAAQSNDTPRGNLFIRSELGLALWAARSEFAWVCVFSFFANLLMLTPTLYMLQVFDRVMLSGNELTLLALTGMMLLFFAVMGVAEWLRARLLVRTGARLDDRLNTHVFNASFEARLRGASRNPLQALNDLTALRQFITGNGVFAAMDLPWVVVYIGVSFLMHPWLGWTSVAFCVVQLCLALGGHWITSARHKRVQDMAIESNTYLMTKLRNAETVEALGMLGNLRRLWLAVHERHIDSNADAHEMAQRIQGVTKFVQYAQQALILAVGALLALDGKISAGAMIAANALMGNALRPISTVVSLWRQYVDASQAYRRLEKVLSENPERASSVQDVQLHGQVSLRQLTATAPGRQTPILDGLAADFIAGEVVAIVGPSGAGKSTLARCLIGIWPETSGEVLLDGHPVEHWSRTDLGDQIGYLPQDIELFDGTIAENIARFQKTAPAAVIDAATRTGIHDMILRLPKGYDTPMGEAGGQLSGGQRQRIGLARALYGRPMLVVLDEPNANLDDAGEIALVKAVRELKAAGSTVFMIVHQRHLLAVADRVLMLEAGKLKALAKLQAQAAVPAQSSNPIPARSPEVRP